MDPLCLFCKTFSGDVERFALLLDSVEKHNEGSIPFVVSVPTAERRLFLDRFGSERFELLADEEFTRGDNSSHGWIQQQIVKMCFWRAERAETAVMLDSDFQFLRSFTSSDFVDKDGTPFLVATLGPHGWEDVDPSIRVALRAESPLPRMSRAECLTLAEDSRVPPPPAWRDRLRRSVDRVRGIQIGPFDPRQIFRGSGPRIGFMPGPVISRRVQETFFREYLRPRALTYSQLLYASRGWEFDWLGEWALARRCHDLRPIPPTFFYFRTDDGIREARAQGVTRQHIARHYMGVALAARHQEILAF